MVVSEKHRDALLEIINIGIGKGASVLNQIVRHHVTLAVPSLEIFEKKSLTNFLSQWTAPNYSAVEMSFSSLFSGSGLLILPTEKASTLVQLFIHDLRKESDMDILNISALTEIGNIVINSVFSTISDQFEIEFKYAVPEYRQGKIDQIIQLEKSKAQGHVILLCKTSFRVIDLDVSGNLILIFSMDTFNQLLAMIDRYYAKLFEKQ